MGPMAYRHRVTVSFFLGLPMSPPPFKLDWYHGYDWNCSQVGVVFYVGNHGSSVEGLLFGAGWCNHKVMELRIVTMMVGE